MARTILVINGPNLNLLGSREPETYGRATLADIKAATLARGKKRGLKVDFRQSNSEGEIIDWIHAARGKAAGIVINGGGYSHTSISIMDALVAVGLPVVEVHISNIHKREAFRHHSYIARVATGTICGLGTQSYLLAIDAMAELAGKA